MATDIIDPALSVATIPSTYTGPATIAAACYKAGGVCERINGFFTSAGNAVQVNAGFRPTSVKIINTTDGLIWEWQYGMATTQSIKTTLGTGQALDTGSAIVVSDPDSGTASNYRVTFSATAMGTSKAIRFQIEG
jgi:hypothetical protein